MSLKDLLSPSHLRGVLLDVDGTLIDSNGAHARAWVQALRDEGFARTFEDVRPLIGMGGDKLVPELTGEDPEGERAKRMKDAWLKHFQPMIPKLQPTRGAREMIEGLLARDLRVAIATSGEAEIVEGLLARVGVAHLKLDRVSSSEVDHSKPDPDLIQVGLNKLGVSAEQALMVGDTPFDAEAARKAGVPSVLLRCGGDARVEQHAYVLDDPRALLEALPDGSQTV
ncbi:HAD family hydrolase [Deinococcus hopiensis]|uniref:Haloacid dehalogenase superfamily, subfamily IA, variant 3 with third motif having DD or ED/haloacid dehalogenase superfamily, subfamily IA, variant 1 with third motif having Dx(3-4)D or Dx(3-4)E n=1 Tax=Deinococcus hopiensis KR-140 TaxID=695939 RepID=A0A1W1VI22_9DEIO|nr:HAD family hydrolase [Deinococcus hopiensis]SMB92976.1 haloacid dehalogenase superfamily, subfamily IA, variant 3 with third motif having DD or ED/haloacid dehalogenase superfamily, subfamily IA, variant 1 with third motif having Dx(3-4)D or Dx(3-4)E [Deinococcus hopiensis KR-140]